MGYIRQLSRCSAKVFSRSRVAVAMIFSKCPKLSFYLRSMWQFISNSYLFSHDNINILSRAKRLLRFFEFSLIMIQRKSAVIMTQQRDTLSRRKNLWDSRSWDILIALGQTFPGIGVTFSLTWSGCHGDSVLMSSWELVCLWRLSLSFLILSLLTTKVSWY